ncbi:MAG: hypothetical protein ACE1ZE_01860, partial [Candidatus Binatia bacterium]
CHEMRILSNPTASPFKRGTPSRIRNKDAKTIHLQIPKLAPRMPTRFDDQRFLTMKKGRNFLTAISREPS